MTYIITYHEDVVKDDISKLSNIYKIKIKKAIQNKLSTQPEIFGKPLRKSLKNYRKLRVDQYRIIFRIKNKHVMIFAIMHRSIVYKKMDSRIM